jgi:hypothetical protein
MATFIDLYNFGTGVLMVGFVLLCLEMLWDCATEKQDKEE